MKYVVVCEGASSAKLYLPEIKKRGFAPIVVYPPRNYDIRSDRFVVDFMNNLEKDAIVIEVKNNDYEGLIKELKKYDIVAVVAGSEFGVRYAEMLARDLHLNGNNADTTYLRCTKKGMDEGLKKRGLRSIATAMIKCDEDIDRFWDENDIDVAFIKHNEGSSSTHNKVCRTRQEAKDYLKYIINAENTYGVVVDVLIQEFIQGKEYVVDTVSCRGHHVITDIWDYEMYDNGDSNIIYKSTRILDPSMSELKELKEYALQVVDALGFEYGPCHGEYFIDKKGPVLVETNARPIGLCMDTDFYDKCFNHHITNLALDTYICPEKFLGYITPDYCKTKSYAKMVMPHSDKEADAEIRKYFGGVTKLKTFWATIPDPIPEKMHVLKTTDLGTAVIVIKLCGKKEDVEKDNKEIEKMEIAFNSSL